MNEEVETVSLPAIRLIPHGEVKARATLHGLIVDEFIAEGKLQHAGGYNRTYESGFVTSRGRFVSHEEAARIADRAEQPRSGKKLLGEYMDAVDVLGVIGRGV